jgi:predicted acylesterase/phospholipase RssA
MKYLVLGPGGMGIYITLGYLKSIEERLDLYQEISGSSAGSIIAGMLALGLTIDQVIDKIISFDTEVLSKSVSIKNLITKFGCIDEKSLKEWFCDVVGCDPTLGDLKKKIHISSYNLKRKQIEYFSNNTHPHMKLSEAIYKSISIPLVFCCNDMYVDGALCEELPIGPFLGYHSDDVDIVQIIFEPREEEINTLIQYVIHIVTALMNNRVKYPEFRKRTKLLIHTEDTINFNMNQEDKLKMFAKGFKENIVSL